MSESLSQIVAELLKKSKDGEELSSSLRCLREEINKTVKSETTIFGQFHGLVESFQKIIPEEKQRFHAAIQALLTTSKMNRQEIVQAVDKQLAELKILEKVLLPDLPGWRDELHAREVKSKEMRTEIAKLRERIAWLENEEKAIRVDMAAREKELALAEKGMRDLFADIGSEIASIKLRIEECAAAGESSQPPSSGVSPQNGLPVREQEGGGRKSDIASVPAQPETEWQKKCPMCGGQMNYYLHDSKWQCYSCAYEELQKPDVQENSGTNKSEQPSPPKAEPASGPIPDSARVMAKPVAALSPAEKEKLRMELSTGIDRPAPETKTCPVCRKKMRWHQTETAWRCSFCGYERST